MKKSNALIFLILFTLLSCTSNQITNTSTKQISPEHKIENHDWTSELSIENKIKKASSFVISYLNKMDTTDKYLSYELTDDEKKLFIDYFNILPNKYKEVIEIKVVVIYFIKNFLGGGMSDFLFDNKENLYIALYLNPDILHINLSDWITNRDNATFINDTSDLIIKADCGTKYYGLLHTLVHEGSHIYDYYYHITPYILPFLNLNSPKTTPFIENIWQDYEHPVPAYDFPNRTNISGWGIGKKIYKSYSLELYKSVSKTPFSSLYATSLWIEDFAEAFTWYYLEEHLGVKYVVNIFENNKLSLIYSPTDNELVKKRFTQFISLLE